MYIFYQAIQLDKTVDSAITYATNFLFWPEYLQRCYELEWSSVLNSLVSFVLECNICMDELDVCLILYFLYLLGHTNANWKMRKIELKLRFGPFSVQMYWIKVINFF